MFRPPPCSTLFPYTTLFRSAREAIPRFRVQVARSLSSDIARQSPSSDRSEEHTSELQSRRDLVCRLLLEKKKPKIHHYPYPPPQVPMALSHPQTTSPHQKHL